MRLVVVLAVWIVVAAAPAAAQTVFGRLTDARSGASLPAVFVLLVDTAGEGRAGALTNAEGRFLLEAPSPGRYRLRTERIGYASHTSPALELRADETVEHDLAVTPEAIELAGIEAEVGGRCTVHPVTGVLTARVWEEARKALEVAAWTEQNRAARFRIVDFLRELDPETLAVTAEERRLRYGVSDASPYVSLPAADLAEGGYVRPVTTDGRDDWEYYAPDAEVMLSDEFLSGHCFSIATRDSEPGLVGLAFRPLGRGGPSDVQGVLWVDRESSELRHVEFQYTSLPFALDAPVAEGRVDFERLPEGPWFVGSWSIRMPRVALSREVLLRMGFNEMRFRLVGVREVGAEIHVIEHW